MALDPKTAREEREAKKAAESVPPELNPPFPYTRLSFDVFFFRVETSPKNSIISVKTPSSDQF